MGHLLSDVRYGLRQLRREPGFTAVAIAVLALGIGATTAIFTVLHEVVLRPLPYFESEQLVYIDVEMPGEESNTSWGVTEAGYFHLRDNQRAFEEIGAYGGAETGHELTIVGPEGGTRVRPPAELVFGQLWLRPSTLVIRLAPEGSGGVPGAVRAIIRDLDPAIAIGRVRTMEEAIAATPAMARTTLTLLLLGVGAVTGLLLSGIGLFGVVAYLVGLRRTEIGIRMALGAPVQRVTSMVLTDGLKLAAVGAALGFLGAVSATRLLESLLFEVSPFDPVTFVFAIPTVLLVALLATWLPARRASRVDPMLALRAD